MTQTDVWRQIYLQWKSRAPSFTNLLISLKIRAFLYVVMLAQCSYRLLISLKKLNSFITYSKIDMSNVYWCHCFVFAVLYLINGAEGELVAPSYREHNVAQFCSECSLNTSFLSEEEIFPDSV